MFGTSGARKGRLTAKESGALSAMVDEVADLVEEFDDRSAEALSLYEDVEVVWNDALVLEEGVLGRFSCLRPSVVELSPVFRCSVFDTVTRQALPVLARELYRKSRFDDSPLEYVVGVAWPLRRFVGFEICAKEVEAKVREMVWRLDAG